MMLISTTPTPLHATIDIASHYLKWRADLSDGIMDWTGGTRRRFTGAKNSNTALKKQKAYFAKARAASHQEPVASHLNPLSSSEYKLANPMGAQHQRRSHPGAHDRGSNHRITSSRGMATSSGFILR